MIDRHFLKLRARDEISREEEDFIRSGVRESIDVRGGRVAIREGVPTGFSTILVSGVCARRKDMRDGRRQYTELHVPGDFTDLHSFTLKHLDHDIVALSNCTFAVVPHEHLKEMTERYPHLTRVYWFGTNLDACIHREWELSLGSRSAIASMAHLFCELYLRLQIVELAPDGTYDLPISQEELGEMIGVTPVHANRTLQQLRKQEVIEFAGGTVTIKDLEGLKRTAEFDPAYLYLERCPSR